MARLLDQDFQRLKEYIEKYSLAGSIESKIREQQIRYGHKHALAALQIWAMAEHLAGKDGLTISGVELKIGTSAYDQFSESFSDLTGSFFAALHGLHKPAMMTLRSAIETFVRGMAGTHSENVLATKNVYQLFDLAKTLPPFVSHSSVHFDSLRTYYGILCDHTHSSSPAHMMKNHAIANFPKYDTNELKQWVKHFAAITEAICSIAIYSNRFLYIKAAGKVQDIFEDVIAKEVRLFSLGAPN